MWLCSPETAAAAALTGCITDPRDLAGELGIEYPSLALPDRSASSPAMFEAPLPPDQARRTELVKAPSIGSLPELDPLPDALDVPVEILTGDDISTDEILPAGAQALPYRSNIAKLADFAFTQVDEEYPQRARQAGQHAIIGGANYGQGSSREHAAVVPRYLGLRMVIAKSYARIHRQNLVNFGVPREFADPGDYQRVHPGDRLTVSELRSILGKDAEVTVRNASTGDCYRTRHRLSRRQAEIVLAGGQIPLLSRSGR